MKDQNNIIQCHHLPLIFLAKKAQYSRRAQHGFTLIELMIVVVIMSILSAIAVPMYRQYVVHNIEAKTQADMQQIEIDLNRWRASALTYQGFAPNTGIDSEGDPTFGYSDADNTFVYLPRGSDATNFNYQLFIVDGADTTQSLIPTTVGAAIGRSWTMLAIPRADGITSTADRMLYTSTGLKCKNANATELTLTSTTCGTGGSGWN